MLKTRLNLAALCLAAMPAFFLYGCGDTDPGLVVAPTYDDSPLQFGISFSGSELKFDWDAVEGVSQYRLTQTAGDAEVIPGGQVLVNGLTVTFEIPTITFDGTLTEFLLEGFDVVNGWQAIGIQNGFGSALIKSELQFSWDEVDGVTEYCLTQTEGDVTIIEGELLVAGLSTSIDVTDVDSNSATLRFALEANEATLGCQEIPDGNNFSWDLVLFESPLRMAFTFTARTIAFGWEPVPGATQYRLIQTAGRQEILPGGQKLYGADELIDRFQVPVHLFDWGGSRFTLEALVDGEWQMAGQQDTAGGSNPLIQAFSEADLSAPSFGSRIAFGSHLSLSEDGTTLAASAEGETSVPLEQRDLLNIDSRIGTGTTRSNIELQFSWNEVAGVTEYCLQQLEGGNINVIPSGAFLIVEGLERTIDITNADLDPSSLDFSLGTYDAELDQCQEIAEGNGFAVVKETAVVALKDSGAVFVYDLETEEKLKVKSPLVDADDQFGRAVALSDDGQVLVVSAFGEDSDVTGVQTTPDAASDNNNAAESGAVYVYLRNGSDWNLEAYIKAPVIDPEPENGVGDVFGWAVALSGDGNTLAISAVGEDSDGTGPENNGTSNSGAVYVYTRGIDGLWALEESGYLKASNAGANDLFGHSLAISFDGNYLAVAALWEASADGAPDNNAKDKSGAVYVFARDSLSNEWVETSYLKASNRDAGDLFGQSISFDAGANILAIGAPSEDHLAAGVTAINSGKDLVDGAVGAAYLFERSGTGEASSWAQKNFYFKASNPNPATRFGQSVVLSSGGDYLAVGATGDRSTASGINGPEGADTLTGSGAAYIFKRGYDNDSWEQIAFVNEPQATPVLFFGSWMDMALNGELLGVAAASLGEQQQSVGPSGFIYLY